MQRFRREPVLTSASTEPRPGGLGDVKDAFGAVIRFIASTEPRPGGLGDVTHGTGSSRFSGCLNGAEARRPR